MKGEGKGGLPAAAPRAGCLVEAREMVKSFGATPALRGASLSVARGEILAVMGPSGSGNGTREIRLRRVVTGDGDYRDLASVRRKWEPVTAVIDSIGDPGRLADAAYERLRQAIFTGQIAPGARMSIPALAARLGVSRSPIREAVLRLVHDGLAVQEPRKGVALIVLDAPQLAEVYEVRAALEGLAARLAAVGRGGPSGAGVARMGEAVAAHADAIEAGDLEAAREADVGFHRITREMAGNAQLTAFLEQIQDKIRLAMATTLVTTGPSLALAEHREIHQAIQAGDPDLAQARAVRHIARLRAALAATPGDPPGQPGDATATDW